jgi:arsenate reductase (glutaredoxin)
LGNRLVVYHYAKCGTCRSAIKWLKARGYELELHDLFEQAPTAAEVKDWLSVSGLELKKFYNTSGEVYREMQLKDKLPAMKEQEQIGLLASNGRLVKRPVVMDGERLTVGFKEEEFEQAWGER